MSRDDLFVFGFWCAAVLALLSPVWVRPALAFFNHGDLYTYHIPLRSLTASELQSGRLPFWNPYILLGVPHLANSQTVLFYPLALLSALFPIVTAFVWEQTFHILWAGAGMFLLARAQRLGRVSAFVLASSYALSPFLIYRVTAGIPTLLSALSWVPWVWLVWLSNSPGLGAVVFALQLLSGHGQFLVINVLAMLLWSIFRDGRWVRLKSLAIAVAGAGVLTCAQSVLTAQYLFYSVRSNWTGAMSGAYALVPGALWTWVNPGALGTPFDGDWSDVLSVFYETCGGWIGPIALALVALGILRGRRRTAPIVLVVTGFLMSLGPRGPIPQSLFGFAVLSYLRTPSRWLLLSLWGGLLLAGAGLAKLKFRLRWALAFAAIIPIILWDIQFLRPQDPDFFLRPLTEVTGSLAGRPLRVLTDPELANPNKSMMYHVMNVNGYEAFYPKSVPSWAAAAEGGTAADASRVFVSKWRSPVAVRAGVAARLSLSGIERGPAWPLATWLDRNGRRILPDPKLWIERPDRWHVTANAPVEASVLALSCVAYPGWSARVGGRIVSLAPWEGAFQALALPEAFPRGAALNLILEFRPTLWNTLIGLMSMAWVAWLIGYLRARVL
jgi:hypothetical protein